MPAESLQPRQTHGKGDRYRHLPYGDGWLYDTESPSRAQVEALIEERLAKREHCPTPAEIEALATEVRAMRVGRNGVPLPDTVRRLALI